MFDIGQDDLMSMAAERWSKRTPAKVGLAFVVLFHIALAFLLVL